MIQNRLHDKDNDIQGLKKQSSTLLNCAWEKGYCAGVEDGYATGREAFKPSDELNEESVKKMARQIQTYCYQFKACVDCPFHYAVASDDMCALERPYNYQVSEV